MSRAVDLTGRRFGKLQVIERAGVNLVDSRAMWKCRCDCGEVKRISSKGLLNGYTKSCGCLAKPNLIGERFGNLVVIQCAGLYEKSRMSKWVCKCDCGGITITGIGNLRNGHTKTCGCYSRTRDGKGKSPEVFAWHKMLRRCYDESNISYHNYGGRGIGVCDRWWSLGNFLKDMGIKPGKKYSLEREDNSGDYSPMNCVWAIWKTQCRNKRNNFIVEYNGKKKCLAEWCEHLELKYGKTYLRLRRYGWTPERAFTE